MNTYKNSFKKRRKLTILSLLALMIICVACSVASLGFAGEGSYSGVELKEYYNLGQEITISDANLSVGGSNYSVKPQVTYPDGSVVVKNEHSLKQLGKYTVVYQTEVDGVKYYQEKEFKVYDYLFSKSSSGETFYYDKDKQQNGTVELSGLRFHLGSGESLLYNKVIDLSEYKAEDTFIKFEIIPEVYGVRDATTLYIILTDLYDSSNKVTIRLVRAPDAPNPNTVSNEITYINAVHGAHALQGMKDGRYYYGKSFRNGMYGRMPNGAPFEFRFDYVNKRFYSYWDNGTKQETNLITDFNTDFGNDPWQGFTAGKCKLSIYAEGFMYTDVNKPFRGMLLEIDGKDLTKEEVGTFSTQQVLSAPPISILYNEYGSASGIPNAVVGYSYKLFDAEYLSVYGGEKLYTNVYYAYTSSSRYEVPVDNGYFTPDRLGVYTIVYTLVDVFGNVTKTEVDVTAIPDNGYGLYLKVPNYESYQTGNVGERFALVDASKVEVLGNYGTAEVVVIAEHPDGDVIDVTANNFIPLKGGKWKITYTAKDYAGRIGKFDYEITIQASDKVIFNAIKDMPKYFIVGTNNVIPDLQYIDYLDSYIEQTATTVYAMKGGVKVADITDGYFNPTEEGVYEIVYKATSISGQENQTSKSVLAIDVGYGKNISTWDRAKYFYSENSDITTKYNSNGVYVTVNGNGKFDFIRPVNAISFSLTLSISGTEKAASKVSIILTDVNNSSQKVKISLVNNQGALNLLINERRTAVVENQTFSDMKATVALSSGVLSCGAANLTLTDYLDGSKFDGFDSLLADLTIETEVDEGVTGNTTVLFDILNGQSFAKPLRKFDGVAPNIVYSETLLNKLDSGEIVKIPHARVVDVMSPNATASLTVLGPDDNPVKDVDGNLLENVAIDQDYYIELSNAGLYNLVYTYADDNGNANSAGLVIDAVSRNKPVITITGGARSVKVGESFTVATAKVTGEFTSYDLYIFVLAPTGNLKKVEMSKDEANYMKVSTTQSGKYKIVYLVIDQWGNQAIAEYQVTAS